MTPRSFHARLVIGVAAWAACLLVVLVLVMSAANHFWPGHGLFLHNSMLVAAAAVVVTAGASVIRRALSPFELLHARLADVRDGRAPRLEGDYPREVMPLVRGLNALLDEREKRIERAVAKAGDLAHGLKTPLAVLVQEIDRADVSGQHELAGTMRLEVERMRRQIASHLAQARATASAATPGAHANVAHAAHGLIRTMTRLYADRRLMIDADIGGDLTVRVPLEDLEEMLGNLLDNACKWARSRVVLSAVRAANRTDISVDDDGAGLPLVMHEHVLRRGIRADETAPGSGLGLAIVRDLAEAYGGTIRLEPSPFGGLRAMLSLPA